MPTPRLFCLRRLPYSGTGSLQGNASSGEWKVRVHRKVSDKAAVIRICQSYQLLNIAQKSARKRIVWTGTGGKCKVHESLLIRLCPSDSSSKSVRSAQLSSSQQTGASTSRQDSKLVAHVTGMTPDVPYTCHSLPLPSPWPRPCIAMPHRSRVCVANNNT